MTIRTSEIELQERLTAVDRARWSGRRTGKAAFVASAILAVVVGCMLAQRTVAQSSQSRASSATPSARDCLLSNGLAYGPFRDGQGANSRIYPTEEQIDEDLSFLSRITKRIRNYGTASTLVQVPRIAKAHGIRVMQGIYLGADRDENDVQITDAMTLARAGLIESLVVGNETLTAGSLPKADLIAYIRKVKREAPAGVPVTTAETASVWASNLDLVREVDFVVAHFYPFWERHGIQGAAAKVLEEYRGLEAGIRRQYPDRSVRIVIGETGWPSAGDPLAEGVVPSAANQQQYFQEFMGVACANNMPFYYFEAFDEEWKWTEGISGRFNDTRLPRDRTFSGRWIGSSWGILRPNGTVKPQLSPFIDQPPTGTRRQLEIFVDGHLAAYYDMGVDSSHKRHEWVAIANDSLKISYPRAQDWGAVFITVGRPTEPPRPWKDFSDFAMLSLDLKGAVGGEAVEIGVKGYSDPGAGNEKRVLIRNLTTQFQGHDVILANLTSGVFVYPDTLKQLNVVVEFVFSGPKPTTVFARNIRYRPASAR